MAFGWWRQRVQHVDGDVSWLHRSQWDLLEARWESRTNKSKYPEKVAEIQAYGVKYYVDIEECVKYLRGLLEKNWW